MALKPSCSAIRVRPLGGFRIRSPLQYGLVLLLTMGLVGLWHGAQWTFVLWGMLNGLFLFGYHMFSLHVLRKHKNSALLTSRPWAAFSWSLSTLIRILLSILFFSPDLRYAWIIFDRLCLQPSLNGFTEPYVLIGFSIILLFWTVHFFHARLVRQGNLNELPPVIRGVSYAALAYVILFTAMDRAEPLMLWRAACPPPSTVSAGSHYPLFCGVSMALRDGGT